MPLALVALAIGAFGIGTTEFVIMGLLPEVSDAFGVSIPTAGFAVTGYALGVVVGAPFMTALGTRLTRKQMLMMLMALFIAGNLLTALAPTFGVLLLGRVLASFTHGAFFGVGSVVAADLVAPNKRAGAISSMFTGLTLANVIGAPPGTLIGQHAGWRVTFFIVAALGVLGLLGITKLIPARPEPAAARLSTEFGAFRNPQVWLAMAMTVLGFGGVFAAITYITPMMTETAGFAESSVMWLLALFGVGMVMGNVIGGRYADRYAMPLLYVSLTGLAIVLGLFTFTAHNKITAAITLMLIGLFGFATVPPLQKRVMDQASAAPTIASAANIAAFNLGNALAAWLGGLVISAGFGYTAPNVVGVGLAISALGVAAFSAWLERRQGTAGGREGRVIAAGGPAADAVSKVATGAAAQTPTADSGHQPAADLTT
ncbi:MFS transporter [Streptomyces zagrosensis]|uniref:DHA1 family inner membrane transport protein n=1 Tax=Streptomyces zagrosensis TaxID=1042984 RepID=A0A7W9UWQ0_9ACTN|nr:MFS transporter [Streptomyces zagrosensis]MBB5934155.1 DHA1 family inner membrane transport protein [Streptomyces zagrosensis]